MSEWPCIRPKAIALGAVSLADNSILKLNNHVLSALPAQSIAAGRTSTDVSAHKYTSCATSQPSGRYNYRYPHSRILLSDLFCHQSPFIGAVLPPSHISTPHTTVSFHTSHNLKWIFSNSSTITCPAVSFASSLLTTRKSVYQHTPCASQPPQPSTAQVRRSTNRSSTPCEFFERRLVILVLACMTLAVLDS